MPVVHLDPNELFVLTAVAHFIGEHKIFGCRKAMMAVCCQRTKGLETIEKLSRVDELSLAERLQGSWGYPGARGTLAFR